MRPGTHLLGWYLDNVLKSDHAEVFLQTVDRFIPCLRGGKVKPKPERGFSRLFSKNTDEAPEKPLSHRRMLAATKSYAVAPGSRTDFVEANALHVANAIELDRLELDLLLLVIRRNRSSVHLHVRHFINDAWNTVHDAPIMAAALLNVATEEVHARREPRARLVASGLIDLDRTCNALNSFQDAVKLQPRVLRLMRSSYADPAACVQALLGTRAETTLRWTDFAHVEELAELAVKVLREAACTASPASTCC